jgi:hypothetical protein
MGLNLNLTMCLLFGSFSVAASAESNVPLRVLNSEGYRKGTMNLKYFQSPQDLYTLTSLNRRGRSPGLVVQLSI